jgi:hypothetical protein
MKKLYILLEWWYEGDSNLVQSFVSVSLTRDEALKKAKEISFYYDRENIKHDYEFEFMKFVNYKTNEVSDIFIEGYDPIEYGGYSSKSKIEIREITLN